MPDFARALDVVADRFIEDAAPVLTELVFSRLDSDDTDALGSLLDRVLADIRAELLEVVELEVTG